MPGTGIAFSIQFFNVMSLDTCSGFPCPIDGGGVICIRQLCLCENSLWYSYNTSRRCDDRDIVIPQHLQRCASSVLCSSGFSVLREECISSRCFISCVIDTDCRQFNAFCATGICMCEYGMVMSSVGCEGLKYINSGDSVVEETTSTKPTLGFWVYVAIIGGILLGSALVLVVVHAIFSVRPVQPDRFRRLTIDPTVENPFAPDSPELYDNDGRRRTYLTQMIEKRFNLTPSSAASSVGSKRMRSLARRFNERHPTLAKKLDDLDRSLSASQYPKDSEGSSYIDDPKPVDAGNRSVARTNASSISSKSKLPRNVQWTPSTKLGSPDGSAASDSSESYDIADGGGVAANASTELLSPPDIPPDPAILRESSHNTERRHSSAIQSLPEEYLDMGLGRVGHRLSIVK